MKPITGFARYDVEIDQETMMFSREFGGWGGMGTPGTVGEFGQMARQYWQAWGQALRGAAAGTSAPPGSQNWQDALQSWTDVFAHKPVTNDVMERFGQQARQWYAQMQQVAAQFGGHGGRPADVVEAWKTALGGASANLFQHLFDSMNGPGMQGMDQWLRGVQPILDALKGEGSTWLNTPAFGFTREHQERWQALAAAQLEVQQATRAYQDLLAGASRAAFQRFEQRLATLAAEGRSVETPRALFDVWVDAAEDAYAEIALSEEYRQVYGDLLNAQMRLRAGIQHEVEHVCAQLGMPTRTELDGAHRKIIELERELRRMRDRSEPASAAASRPEPAPSPHQKPANVASGTSRSKPGTTRTAATKTASKVAKKKAPARKTAKSPAAR